jgi:23S rRNA (cytosine1962-C5)-methyltransferase
MTKRPVVHLKPREGRRLRAGAPWVFSNELVMDPETKALAPGSLVSVLGDDGRAFGTFYFNPKSLIALRRLDAAGDAAIDEAWFAKRLARAKALRQALYERHFYRLVHAEGDHLPGLTIDRFDDVFSVQVTTAGMEALEAPLLAALEALFSPRVVVLRNDTPVRALEGLDSYVRAPKGEVPKHLALEENGIRYFADLAHGQKTGWYYDQRESRAFMARLANERSVLDAYSYAGGFALAAAAQGAREAVALDSSAPALALAEEAAAANKLSGRCRFVKADVFEELERLAAEGERFDIVIADPPPFVKAKKDLEAGAKAYRKLARLAANVAAPGGFLFLASCSHNMPADRFGAECAFGLARAGREGALIRAAGAGPDHPIHPSLPESAYLKALIYALD